MFVSGGGGTSFDGHPLPTEQFALGGPFRLGAYNVGEQRGDHYLLATGGYLRQVMRLPDFLGGPVFVGGWLDNGAAFDAWKDANWATQASVGVIVDTLLGPAFVATSVGVRRPVAVLHRHRTRLSVRRPRPRDRARHSTRRA